MGFFTFYLNEADLCIYESRLPVQKCILYTHPFQCFNTPTPFKLTYLLYSFYPLNVATMVLGSMMIRMKFRHLKSIAYLNIRSMSQ